MKSAMDLYFRTLLERVADEARGSAGDHIKAAKWNAEPGKKAITIVGLF